MLSNYERENFIMKNLKFLLWLLFQLLRFVRIPKIMGREKINVENTSKRRKSPYFFDSNADKTSICQGRLWKPDKKYKMIERYAFQKLKGIVNSLIQVVRKNLFAEISGHR